MWSILFPVVALVSTFASVTASPIQLTNAELLQRGLPLKAPAKRHVASRSGALRPRQSNNVDPTVIQVVTNVERKRGPAANEYLVYDSATGSIITGSLENALLFELGADSVLQDDPLIAESDGTQFYVANVPEDIGGYIRGDVKLSTTSDGGAPIGKAVQTTIWNYLSTSNQGLYANYFSNDPKRGVYLGLDSGGALITCNDYGGLSNPIVAKVVNYADALAAEPAPQPETKYALRVYSTDNTPNTQYVQYVEPQNGLGSFQYVADISLATVFVPARSTVNTDKDNISFEYNGEIKKVGVKFQQKVCSQCPAQYTIVPTPSAYDNINTQYPIETEVWQYSSPLDGISGFSANLADGTNVYLMGQTYLSGNQYYDGHYGNIEVSPYPIS